MTAPGIDSIDLIRIADRYGLPTVAYLPPPWIGGGSRVYPLGDVVLKVPFDTPDAIQCLTVDTAISALMRQRGVQTPELLAHDESRDILPVPFALYRRMVDSMTLQAANETVPMHQAWREAGRQLAIVHAHTDRTGFPVPLRSFRQTPELDPRPWVDTLHGRGALGAADATWLHAILEDLAPTALASEPVALCHGDVNAANILVDQVTGGFLGIIDWAGAGWLDPAWDFAGMPLNAVPYLLAGHREVAPMPDDDTVETRIFWCQAQTRLYHAIHANDRTNQRVKLDRDIRHLRRFAADILARGS